MKIKNSVLRDKFELCDPKTGEITKEIPFTINVAASVNLVTKKQREMAEISQDPEKMGKTFIELLTSLFGEEATTELLNYFQNDYMQMIVDIAPVLTDEVFPMFDRYRQNVINAKKKAKK